MKRALRLSASLALALASPSYAAPPIVGAASQPALTAETARAQAAEAIAQRYQTAVTARAPGFTDDPTVGFTTAGQTWLADDLYTLMSPVTGTAGWQRTPNHLLPSDQIGLHLTGATLVAAGSGYAVGNTVTLTGGAVVTVATITGGGSTGPIGTVAALPAGGVPYHACYNANAGGLAQNATSGTGTGATFTGAFIGPFAFGARTLTRCYLANSALDLANNITAPVTIGFAPGGLIDYTAIDLAFPTPNAVTNGRPAIVTIYDQGINGANGTNSAAYGCTIGPLRVVRGMRTIACDGDASQGGPLDSGAPNAITTINLPNGVSVNNQANTLIFVGGVQSLDHKTGLVNVGGTASPNAGLYNKVAATVPNIGLSNGATNGTPCPGMPYDKDNVIFGVSSATASLCVMNGVTGTAGGVPTAGTDTGGFIGYTYDGSGYGYQDFDAVIIVPWAMSAAEIAAADASIQSTFGIQRQGHGVVAFDGDSDTDGHGSPDQHGWVRMFAEQLALTRPDIKIVSAAFFGSTMGGAAANGSPGSRLTEEPLNVLPVLDAAYAQNASNIIAFMGPMGNNDFNRGDTLTAVEGYYTQYCTAVHTHHGLCVLSYFTGNIGASGSTGGLAAWLAAAAGLPPNAPGNGPGADAVVPFTSCPSASITCNQSDQLHPNQANDGFQATSALRGLAPVLH
jgi:hypothetical protein